MKFEDRIDSVVETLGEAGMPPMPTVGTPPAVNPQAVPQQAVSQQPITPQTSANSDVAEQIFNSMMQNRTPEQGEVSTEEFVEYLGNMNPQDYAKFKTGTPANPQVNPDAASDDQQTTSTAPASTSTSGVTGVAGAISTEV